MSKHNELVRLSVAHLIAARACAPPGRLSRRNGLDVANATPPSPRASGRTAGELPLQVRRRRAIVSPAELIELEAEARFASEQLSPAPVSAAAPVQLGCLAIEAAVLHRSRPISRTLRAPSALMRVILSSSLKLAASEHPTDGLHRPRARWLELQDKGASDRSAKVVLASIPASRPSSPPTAPIGGYNRLASRSHAGQREHFARTRQQQVAGPRGCAARMTKSLVASTCAIKSISCRPLLETMQRIRDGRRQSA